MDEVCAKRGASERDGSHCIDHFHALLVLKGTFPDAPGSMLHFYAVASYNLQSPETVGLTPTHFTAYTGLLHQGGS